MKVETQAFSWAASRFQPVAIGMFGLGTGIHLGWPVPVWFSETQRRSEQNDGNVGLLDAGVRQFLAGVSLLVGLAGFNVFRNAAPLCTAGLAFTAYGFHWFAMAYWRYIDSSARPAGWMAIALIFLSVLGVDVFRRAGDIPVMLSLSA